MKTAVLLAAGRGSRLRPHTDLTPKPLLPVNGAPTLDLYFQALQATNVERVVLVTHHLADQIEQYAKQVSQRFQLACTTVHQQTLDGTASALDAAIPEMVAAVEANAGGAAEGAAAGEVNGDDNSGAFILMATDYLIPKDFIADLIRFHQSHDAEVTVSLKRVPLEELSSRSSVRFDSNEYITEIVEKPMPGKAPSELGANLAFVLPLGVLQHLSQVQASARGEREVQSAINTYLASGGRARGLIQETPSEWTPDLG